MAKIIIDKTSFIYEDSRRIRTELVNVADYYNNFTAAPLNTLDEIDGKLDMHLVLAEMLAPIYSQHNKDNISDIVLLFRIAKYLQGNVLPYNILYISDKANGNINNIIKVMKYFNKDSKLYLLSDINYNNYIKEAINLRMPLQEMILPDNKFDIIVVDDIEDFSAWVDIINKVIFAIKPYGQIFSISNDNDIIKGFNSIFENSMTFAADTKRKVQEATIPHILKNDFIHDTDHYKLKKEKQIIADSVTELGEIFKIYNQIDFLEVLPVMSEIENKIANINYQLNNRDIKYYANLLKQAILEYHLKQNDIDNVFNRYNDLIEEMQRCGDFSYE